MSMPSSGAVAVSPYAGFWLRFVAAIIDGILLFVFRFVVAFILAAVVGGDSMVVGANGAVSSSLYMVAIVTFIITMIAALLYWGLMESGPGQATLGKRVLKLKVTNMSGGRIDLGTAILRSWVHWLYFLVLVVDLLIGLPFFANGQLGVLSGIVALLALISAIVIAFTPMKQGLHDQMAKTLVVRA